MKATRSTHQRITCFVLLSFLLEGLSLPAFANADPTQRETIPAVQAMRISQNPMKTLPDNLLAQTSPDLPAVVGIDKSELTGVERQSISSDKNPDHDLMHYLLRMMAYEKDPLLRKFVKRKDQANTILLVGSIGVFGVSLADHIYVEQHIYKNSLLIPRTFETAKIRQVTVANFTVIYDSITVATALLVASWSLYYKRKIDKRKALIDAQINRVIYDLNNGANDAYARGELMGLLKNDEGIKEYLNLWHATHPKPATEPSPITESGKLRRIQF